MDSIQFTFYNRTVNKLDNHFVVVFQNPWPKATIGSGSAGTAEGAGSQPATPKHLIAWKVIQKCNSNMYHPFSFPMDIFIAAQDTHGNMTTPVLASAGMTIEISGASGDLELAPNPSPTTPAPSGGIVVSNTASEAVDVVYLRNGVPFAVYENLLANSQTSITVPTELSVGLIKAFTSASKKFDDKQYFLSKDNWPQSIEQVSMGISSADIYMTGGGTGTNAKPISFSFQNVVL